MPPSTTTLPTDAALVSGVLGRMARDLGTVMGHDVRLGSPLVTRARARPAGAGGVHISFKLCFSAAAGEEKHGALLVALREALTMGCYHLMLPDERVAALREEPAPDAALKDALLELGSMLGGAAGTALAELGLAGWSVRSSGCQGVRAGVRPAFPYAEGSELVVARLPAELEPFPPFELILLLPALG